MDFSGLKWNKSNDLNYDSIVYDLKTDNKHTLILYKQTEYIIDINANLNGNSVENWLKLQDNIMIFNKATLKIKNWPLDNIVNWKNVIRNSDYIRKHNYTSASVGDNDDSDQGRILIERPNNKTQLLPLYRIINKFENKEPSGNWVNNGDWNNNFDNVVRYADKIIYDLVDAREINTTRVHDFSNQINIFMDFKNLSDISSETVSKINQSFYNNNSINDNIKKEYNNNIVDLGRNTYTIKMNDDLASNNQMVLFNNKPTFKYKRRLLVDDTESDVSFNLKTSLFVRELIHCLGFNNFKDVSNNNLSKIETLINIELGIQDLSGYSNSSKYKDIITNAGYPVSLRSDISFAPLATKNNGVFDYQTADLSINNILFPTLSNSIMGYYLKDNVELTEFTSSILTDLSYNINKESEFILKVPQMPSFNNQLNLERGILGDPYVVGLNSGKIWKMPNFEGFSRMLKGKLYNKEIIINVETRINTESEALESERFTKQAFSSIGVNYENVKNQYDLTCKGEAFMRRLWIKYDNKELLIDMNNLSLNNNLFNCYETDEYFSFPKYNCHGVKSILIVIEKGFELIVSKYPNPQVKTGFRVKCGIKIEDGQGALLNQLYKNDMILDKLESEVDINYNNDRNPRELRREKYWNSKGEELINEVNVY